MSTKTTIAALSSAIEALRNCERSGNVEWKRRHGETIERILSTAPHGSGLDGETKLVRCETTADRCIVLLVDVHRMNADGYYCGWRKARVTFHASFSGVDVNVTGSGIADYKDWIAETFLDWARSPAQEN